MLRYGSYNLSHITYVDALRLLSRNLHRRADPGGVHLHQSLCVDQKGSYLSET